MAAMHRCQDLLFLREDKILYCHLEMVLSLTHSEIEGMPMMSIEKGDFR